AEWLTRRIEMVDRPGTLPGWRLLMMMLEHEVHHRSQIDTYAGLQGWPVPQIFERAFESIQALQPGPHARFPVNPYVARGRRRLRLTGTRRATFVRLNGAMCGEIEAERLR